VDASILLLHIGHAKNEVEAVLTLAGLVLTLLGLGLAVWALWPRRRSNAESQRRGRVARWRALRHDEAGPPASKCSCS
jgi:hypothetical protein